jgi:uncharacterized membrane protein YhaH (DUF805 family)
MRVSAMLLLLAALTLARVASTYRTFNATSDEPAHIAAGMEWLQFGDYTYEWQHPPLARVAVAVGPYIKGLRSQTQRTPATEPPAIIFTEGYDILYSDGDYWTNLTLARLGTLPFLLLAGAVTFAWGRRYFAEPTALLAVALLFSLPPILGHAGLATLDIACAATVMLALYQFLRWLDAPSLRRGLIWGAAIALAVLTKYSSLPFLIVCCVPALLLARKHSLRRLLPSIAAAKLIAILILWAGFRFSIHPLDPQAQPHPAVDRLIEQAPFLAPLMHIPLPLTELLLGLRDIFRHNALGHDSFLLGEFRTTGWWYFFPVVLAVKTPLGFLGLALAGLALTLRRWREAATPRYLTAIFFCAILLFSLTSRIDLGVRHVLSLYPLLALLGADLAVRAWRHSRLTAMVAGLLVAATVAESVQAHPDYLAHFNPSAMALTGGHPETILCESDLDWGQDLDRLSRRLGELGADHVSVAYFGSAPLDRAGFPPYRNIGPEQPIPGYIAVSVRYLELEYARNKGFYWLRGVKPVERIGKSIDLFYLDPLP